jgi:hypothetical protein
MLKTLLFVLTLTVAAFAEEFTKDEAQIWTWRKHIGNT